MSGTTILKNQKSDHDDIHDDQNIDFFSRRSFLESTQAISLAIASAATISPPSPAFADETPSGSGAATYKSTANAEITSKVVLTLKGLPTDESNDIPYQEDTITIGLFGKDAPQPTETLIQLFSPRSGGYPALCKPKETRTLQREQLEANKVYNACKETEDSKGVDYDLSTVWRVKKDERIDLGAVSGKYVARIPPNFQLVTPGGNGLKHDAEGVVSVRRGSDGGFGFTIYPGSSSSTGSAELDEDNIVVGRVIDGMDVVRRLNQIPVVQSAGINYKGFAGGDKSEKRSAPSRACRYGSSELYCNEFKPLKKILISRTNVLS